MIGRAGVDPAAMRALVARGTPIAQFVLQLAKADASKAQGRAPHLTGRLIAGVQVRDGEDSRGYYADIVTTAANPRTGFKYGTYQELRQPYIRPAVR